MKCICALPDGNRIASGSADMTIRVWSLSSGLCEGVLRGHDNVSMLSMYVVQPCDDVLCVYPIQGLYLTHFLTVCVCLIV